MLSAPLKTDIWAPHAVCCHHAVEHRSLSQYPPCFRAPGQALLIGGGKFCTSYAKRLVTRAHGASSPGAPGCLFTATREAGARVDEHHSALPCTPARCLPEPGCPRGTVPAQPLRPTRVAGSLPSSLCLLRSWVTSSGAAVSIRTSRERTAGNVNLL